MTGSITGWVKLFVVRLLFEIRLTHICRKNGFGLEKNGFFRWLGRNKSAKHNYTVDCGGERYCVKLIGVRSKRILYGFINENYYEIKDYTFALVHTMDGFEYKAIKKEPYLFKNGTTPCIVMIPSSVKVTVRRESAETKQFEARNGRIEIGNGDMTPEGRFFFADRFLDLLKERANAKD